MIVKVVEATEKWKGDKASLYLVTVEAGGKRYQVRTWSRVIGQGIGKEFDVVSEKKENKRGETESFIKQIRKAGGNGFYKTNANLAAIALQCSSNIVAAQIRNNDKIDPGNVLNIADNFLTWLKSKEV